MKSETKQQIREALESYMLEHNVSANFVAKQSGVNASVLSSIRNGKETIKAGGDKEVEISDKYYKMLADCIGFSLEKKYWEIIPTSQLLDAISILEDARTHGFTNIIIGATGCGKTVSVDTFVKKYPVDCFSIKVGKNDNIGDIIDKLLESMNINTEARTKSKKIREIIKHMRDLRLDGQKPTIIFDESEYMKQPTLCTTKELIDNLSGICGVVFIGTQQLLRNIEKLRMKDRDGIPQFWRRVKFGIRYLNNIDRTFKQFLNGLNITDKSLTSFIRENCENYGELHDVLVPAMVEADRTNQPLTEEFVRLVLNMPKR